MKTSNSTAEPRCIERGADAHLSWIWLALGVLVVSLCIGWLALPLSEWAGVFQSWILGFGLWGVAIFAGAFIVATLVLAPDFPLAVAAGMVYGLWAFPVVLTAAMIASSLAFLTARYLVRHRVQAILAKRRKFAAIDKAVSEEGWKIVILLRFSPLVPFNVQNYVFGVTAIPFGHYFCATFVGIIPGTALFVYLGALGNGSSGGPLVWVFFGVGLLATVVAAILVTGKAKAKLAEAGIVDRSP
jgi:uncharacterized membrane protein YdjX (TVP38/TMEM64 family)